MLKQRPLSEKDLQAGVEKLARTLGWLCYHTWNSMHSAAGFPDLVLLRNGLVYVVELKSERREPTPEQERWLDAWRETGAAVYVWKPSDLESGRILAALR